MIEIYSSEGDMRCHDDGTPYAGMPETYANIARFDIKRLERMCAANHISIHRSGGWDILALGYWLEDGSYENPAAAYAENGVMRHIWCGHADDIDQAIELGGDW